MSPFTFLLFTDDPHECIYFLFNHSNRTGDTLLKSFIPLLEFHFSSQPKIHSDKMSAKHHIFIKLKFYTDRPICAVIAQSV